MRKIPLRVLVYSLYLIGASSTYLQTRPSRTTPKVLSARQIVERVMPSVVLVVTQDEQGETIAQGSGFVYKQGLVATNLHVFKRASRAFVRVVGGNVNYKITEVVGIDIRNDLCVIRIEEKSMVPLTISLNRPAIGDEVFTFGSPKGLEGTVSKGIVSSVRSDLNLLQIDASISPGSSGGPVVNDRAEVIGIAVSSLTSGQNLNFAIPSVFLTKISDQQFVDQLLRDVARITGRPFKSSVTGVSVSGAGAASVSDREDKRLKGPVRIVSGTYAPFEYNERLDKYVEEPRKTSSGRVVFDEQGNLTEDWNYHYGDLAWKYFYFYDDNGFRTRVTWEPASGTNGKRETFNFTPREAIYRRIDVDRINLAGTFESSQGKWVYDVSGNNLETDSRLIGTRSLRSYDRNGLLVDDKYYVNGKLTQGHRYTYEFDQAGNWIKSFVSKFDSRFPSLGYIPSSVNYREISYFKN